MCNTETIVATAAGAALMYYTGGLGAAAGTGAAATTGAAVGAGIGTANAQANAMKSAAGAQEQANQINREEMTKVADTAEAEIVKAESKSPDIQGMQSANALNAKGGQSGTMLTGPSGVDPMTLLLGKKTLLGS